MNNMPRPEIERVSVTWSISATGWTSTALPSLGRAGKVLSVKLREDATLAKVDGAVLYVTDGAKTATPTDESVFYASGALAVSGHATSASLRDVIDGGAPYRVAGIGDLHLVLNATSAGGSGASGSIFVDLIAEVWA